MTTLCQNYKFCISYLRDCFIVTMRTYGDYKLFSSGVKFSESVYCLYRLNYALEMEPGTFVLTTEEKCDFSLTNTQV